LARFRPFRGIRYVRDRAEPLDRVVAPPYDVISPERRDELYDAGPHNVTRLILNRDGHEAAGALFRRWLAEGVLAPDPEPTFYLYCQDFDCRGPRRRTGVIGALGLEPFSTGVVRPHERTFPKHKKDRFELTGQVKANLSPIFGLYSNVAFSPEPDGGWISTADIDVEFEGVRNRLWCVRDPDNVAAIREAVADRTIFIADGHHRYETALEYCRVTHPDVSLPLARDGDSDEVEPTAFVLAFLARFEDPGMIILPTHREVVTSGGADYRKFVEALAADFEVERIPKSGEGRNRMLATLESASPDTNTFGVAVRDFSDYLIIRRRAGANGASRSAVADLDVSVLHTTVLGSRLEAAGGAAPQLAYSAEASGPLDRVDAGRSEAAFFMKAMLPEQMERACMAGELLPQKSTYFFPKLLTGLVCRSLERRPSGRS
jgi:uncharacterized protein (DUF1015 family)